MPPEGRLRARRFWDKFMQKDPEIWPEINQRYDYLIAPDRSSADDRLAAKFTVSKSLGGYSVYRMKMGQ